MLFFCIKKIGNIFNEQINNHNINFVTQPDGLIMINYYFYFFFLPFLR